MKNIIKVTLFSLLSSSLPFNAIANDAHHSSSDITTKQSTENTALKTISTMGIIKQIDTDTKKLTIAHEAIPSINWPAMTMRFTYEEPSMITDIKEGSQVNLDFIQQGNISLITKITVTQ